MGRPAGDRVVAGTRPARRRAGPGRRAYPEVVTWPRRLLWGLIRLLVVAVGAAALGVVAAGWYVDVMSRDRITALSMIPPQPVAIVLGGVGEGEAPTAAAKANLDVAAAAYASGKAKVILVSADDSRGRQTPALRAYLIARGIPEAKVVTDPRGGDDYTGCVRARQVFGVNQAVLAVEGAGLPRALATCRAVGVEAWAVAGGDGQPDGAPGLVGLVTDARADVLLFFDVLSRREPVLGPRQDSVDVALRATAG